MSSLLFRNNIVSSAICLIFNLMASFLFDGSTIPQSLLFQIFIASNSIANMNATGENTHHCLIPHFSGIISEIHLP